MNRKQIYRCWQGVFITAMLTGFVFSFYVKINVIWLCLLMMVNGIVTLTLRPKQDSLDFQNLGRKGRILEISIGIASVLAILGAIIAMAYPIENFAAYLLGGFLLIIVAVLIIAGWLSYKLKKQSCV